MQPEVMDKKDKLVKAMKILLQERIIDRFGNVSARLEGERILTSAHRHVLLEEITTEDIVTIDYAGDLVEGKTEAPGEKFLHLEIYKLRPDVGAVVHAHPPVSTAFSVAGQTVKPVLMESVVLAPEVAIFDYPCVINSQKLAQDMALALGDRSALLLRSHGTVTVGRTIEEACVNTLLLEKTAQVQMMAGCLGQVRTICDPALTAQSWKDYQHFVESSWPDLAARVK